MKKFQVWANAAVFGIFPAEDEQAARDACAREAGYESEADMVEQLGQPSELNAVEVECIPQLNAEGQAQVRLWVQAHARDEEAELAVIASWYEKAEAAASNAAHNDSVIPIEMSARDASSRHTECLSLPWEAFDWLAVE